MKCEEARKVLYDLQTHGVSNSSDERVSLVSLAKAHLHVCLACNEFFERERAFIATLRDRVLGIQQPMPQAVLAGVLKTVHDARMTETTGSPRSESVPWWKRLFR